MLPQGTCGWVSQQDIYTAALNLNGALYGVIIRVNEPNEHTKELAEKYGNELPDNYYKEHRLNAIEIEIAPAHNGASAIDNNGGSRPGLDISNPTGAVHSISLGILRGIVKPSFIANNALYDKTKYGKAKGAMYTLLDGRRMVALFENHEASTVLHEMAHFWLEELRDAQRVPSCPDWAKQLWHDLEDAYGFSIKTVKHSDWLKIQERFAHEFENYCMEGVAPAPSLRCAFEIFGGWVSKVYDHVLEIVGCDKIRVASRKVFDAILGGDESESEKEANMPFKM